MNSLSWFIYLADIVSSIKADLSWLSISLMIISLSIGFTALISTLSYGDGKDFPSLGENTQFHAMRFTLRKYFCILICTSLFLGGLNTFIPSRNTLLLIAGSQISQQIVMSPIGQQVLDKIKQGISNN